jgi:hypothetical protein
VAALLPPQQLPLTCACACCCRASAGRNILDHAALREQGFIVYALGKPLEAFLRPAQF